MPAALGFDGKSREAAALVNLEGNTMRRRRRL
jgi:hypothetical protein